jgi:hypothetical protein
MGERQVQLGVVGHPELLGTSRRDRLQPARAHAQQIRLAVLHEENDAGRIGRIGNLEPEEVDEDQPIQGNERHISSFLDHDPLGGKRRHVDSLDRRRGRSRFPSLTGWRHAMATEACSAEQG